MNVRSILLTALALGLVSAGPAVLHAEEMLLHGKARAPVRIEWTEPSREGRLAVVLHPEADYDRLEATLIVGGRELPGRQRLDAGSAGTPLRLEWDTAGAEATPRLLVVMFVDGQPLRRAASPRTGLDASSERPQSAGAGRLDREAGLRILPAVREPER